MKYLINYKLFEGSNTTDDAEECYINLFKMAVTEGDTDILKLFVEKGSNIEDIDLGDVLDDTEKLRYLLENGASTDDMSIGYSSRSYLSNIDVQKVFIDFNKIEIFHDNKIAFDEDLRDDPKYSWVLEGDDIGLF